MNANIDDWRVGLFSPARRTGDSVAGGGWRVAGVDEENTAACEVAENAATCDAESKAADSGVKPASDTNEANFDAHVIHSQTPEVVGVMSELAVGAGLDNDGGVQVVSPDLVCPGSELGLGEKTRVVDEENTGTFEASPELGDLGVKPASDTNEAEPAGLRNRLKTLAAFGWRPFTERRFA